ncbi:hypothetical protein HMPREF9278_1619 [Mobiluncus mulieris FB024-16]|nr:hypothetical protein HMPREF9278_1619 [Mobiluncus mulieris FB024-16]
MTCGKTGVKKNGTTTSGAIRWRCNNCGASWSNIRDDISHAALFDKFVNWLVGKQTQSQASPTGSDRTWRAKIEWCWRVSPVIPITGEVCDYIQIDGTYLPYGWCLLVAQTQGKVLAIQWCQRENATAYKALLQRLPPPLLVLTDGNAGALRAISEVWPDTVVQLPSTRQTQYLRSNHPHSQARCTQNPVGTSTKPSENHDPRPGR